MLVITRRKDESIDLDGPATVVMLGTVGNRVRLGIHGEARVKRSELANRPPELTTVSRSAPTIDEMSLEEAREVLHQIADAFRIGKAAQQGFVILSNAVNARAEADVLKRLRDARRRSKSATRAAS